MSNKNANLPSPWRVTMSTPSEAVSRSNDVQSASQCLRIASPPEQVEAERAAKLTWARATRDTRAHADKLAEALRSLLYETDHIEHIRPQLNKAAAALAAYEKEAAQ